MLSAEMVNEIVGRALGSDCARVLGYRLVAHSEDGAVGFLGDHRNLVVELRRGDEGPIEQLRFFVKTLPKLSERQLAFVRGAKLFQQEVAFFTKLVPLLDQGFSGERFCPRCLLTGEEFIVLEDMRELGYGMLDDARQRGLGDKDHLLAAARAQARLHAASLLAEARLGRPLDEYCPEACVEHLFGEANYKTDRVGLYVDLIERVARELGLEDGRLATAMRRGFMRMYRRPPGMRRVLCHGDNWANNYLFEESSRPFGCVMVDFQLCRYGPGMYDVVQLMYLSGNRGLRERWEREVVEGYREEMCGILGRNEPGIEGPSFEELWREYEDLRLTAMYAYVMYHPILGMCKEMFAKFEKDPDYFYDEIMFRKDNVNLVELYRRYPGYMSGLAELAKELVEYCEKHDIPEQKDKDEGKTSW
ncbi:uncharacterized protein LOC106643675 [Copidosoma floridanum]|uniref:uncharacterized protein LOC106643675 n=1 Tax=Copidosoma floridanum TaxID=29053 RepID=UPI0006C9CB5C|nr:uncharacterized protein LOC106643675 [Copidosoma floridanum]